ncbi:sigma-E factor negative regulatory protein [Granulosicoccus sp. 3-233]|uniref:sigma-E factor negative regulatory protein n=1 Tax=Granulosicoccus sp. 3-233 TaxID=3417969 RepID=UPI003D32B3B9
MQDSNNPPMNKETLSQLMDGEWHDLNPSDCVQGVCADEELRGKWARYHLIRDVIKNEPIETDHRLVSRICDAIADEPAYSNITPLANYAELPDKVEVAPVSTPASAEVTPLVAKDGRGRQSSWLGTGMAGFALAASVAAVTVVGMNVWQNQQLDPVENVASVRSSAAIDGRNVFSQQVSGAPLPQVELVANTGSYWVSPQSSKRVGNEEQLNMYLSQHIENSPTSDREGLLPYSRLVGYDERVQER